MLRSLIGESPKQWDKVLAQGEFSYNDSSNISTGMSPFKIMYRDDFKEPYLFKSV